ncbi:MAG TPA: cation transporter [Actinomycetota bacterium]|nr:cation transporter [Actinomycetota bacterium]
MTGGLPPDKRELHRRAVRLQWVTIAHVSAAGVALFLTAGSSQAMKAAYLDDIIGLVPPIAYLVALRYNRRAPTERFPYGYHRSLSIAFFWAAIALVGLGLFILIDSLIKLVTFEHPTIGSVELFGAQIWLGWLMLPALAFTGIPQFLLGRAKLPLAEDLNDKVLHADAGMNRADWLAAGAAFVGVIGIAFGLWWADSVAATFIAVEVIEEGVKHLRGVSKHLLGETPTSVDYKETIEVPERVEEHVRRLGWVRDARARLREEGRVYFGEVFVEPRDGGMPPPDALDDLTRALYDLDWRIRDVVVVPVSDLDADSDLRGLQGAGPDG